LAAEKNGSKWAARIGVIAVAVLCAITFKYALRTSHTDGERVIPVGAVYAEAERPSTKDKASKPVVPPEQLYRKAWMLIQDMYFDKKYGDGMGKSSQDWGRWRHRYDGKLKTADDAHKAIETMVSSLGDPYTRFLSEEAFTEEKSQIEAHLFGVGMQLGMNKEHKVVVIAPIQDTPAYRAGVHPGDEIIEVDKKPVKGQSLDQVVKQIRGLPGSQVNITFLRGPDKVTKTMTRAEVPIRAVANVETLPGNVGYIRLDSFISHKADEEMRDALKKVSGTKGLILDLRNNPGGLLANAIQIANMFLDHGVIVSTIDADGYKNSTIASHHPISNLPMVILINQGSASASEILSGALHDNHRALLVGQKTFGKGLVQSINKLEDGSGINITIAKYLTPNDTDIHKSGIVPDYTVEVKEDELKAGKGPWWVDPTYTNFKRSPNDGKDLQLTKALEVIKKEIANGATVAAGSNSAPAGRP
jgi:carboxyl-terminal processing protease